MAIASDLEYDLRQFQGALEPLYPPRTVDRARTWDIEAKIKSKWHLYLISVGPRPATVEDRFRKLVNNWRLERRGMSSTSGIIGCDSYRDIIRLGLESSHNLEKIKTLLLFELQSQPDFWFSALRELTDVDPVTDKDRGNIKRMADAWVRWGQRQGYLPRASAESTRASSWVQEVLAALDELHKYPTASDSWSPRRPTSKALSLAKQLIASVKRKDILPKPRFWATPEGGVSIGWRMGRRTADFDILADGSIQFAKREQDKPSTGGGINQRNYQTHVNKVLGWLLE